MIRGEGDNRADRLERALVKIRELVPRDSKDPYDRIANASILLIIEENIGKEGRDGPQGSHDRGI